MKQHSLRKALLTSVLALAINGSAVAEIATVKGTLSSPTSIERKITPYIIQSDTQGGNRTCGEVGDAFFGNAEYYQCYSGRVNYDSVNGSFGNTFVDVSGNVDCANTTINATVTDGTYVSWSSTGGPVGAAIVKGSDAANVYNYDPPVNSDSGLASPRNSSGNYAGLSNLTFCWNPDPQEPPVCYASDTAWGAGSRYLTRGNWGTYTAYEPNKTVNFYAGQTKLAGTVNFSAIVGGKVTITITLNEGWRFRMKPANDVEGKYANNVHVNGYVVAPVQITPIPGTFPSAKVAEGSSTTIEVPAYTLTGEQYNFYGVHAAVESVVACPVAIQ